MSNFNLYVLISTTILVACGLPWLFIRRRISNQNVRRMLSSLIIALAIAPMSFAGDKGGFIVPAIILLPVGLMTDFALFLFCLGVIVLFCGTIYIIQSLCCFFCKKEHGNKTLK